jgi:MFS family permease
MQGSPLQTPPAATAVPLACPACDRPAPAGDRYCGACGVPLSMEPWRAVEWRGPRRFAVIGLLVLIVGSVMVWATASTLQMQGTDLVLDKWGGPLLNKGLELAGIGEIDLPERDRHGAAWTTVAAFVIGCAIASCGGALLFIGLCWGSLRFKPHRRGRVWWERRRNAA